MGKLIVVFCLLSALLFGQYSPPLSGGGFSSLSGTLAATQRPDQTSAYLREEFTSDRNVIGNLNWTVTTIAATVATALTAGTASHPGIFEAQATTLNANASVILRGLAPFILNATLFDSSYVFNISTTSTVAAYVGLVADGTLATPGAGFYVRYDTSKSDTSWQFVTSDSSATVTSSAIAPVASTFATFRIRSIVAGTILYSINGGAETAVLTNVTATPLQPFFWIKSLSAGGAKIDCDYFSINVSGLSR